MAKRFGQAKEPDHFLAGDSRVPGGASRRPRARDAFAKWYDLVCNNRFASFNEVRRTFPSADLVEDLVVFNIRGNRYRLVTRFVYEKGRVYIRRVLTDADYDRGDWRE